MIQSVLGPVRPAELGVCLPHEHLWCDQLLAPRRELMGTRTGSGVFMQLLDFEAMVAELGAFREAGGGAVVEVTCDGWGRGPGGAGPPLRGERGAYRRHGGVLHRTVHAGLRRRAVGRATRRPADPGAARGGGVGPPSLRGAQIGHPPGPGRGARAQGVAGGGGGPAADRGGHHHPYHRPAAPGGQGGGPWGWSSWRSSKRRGCRPRG